MSQCVFTTNSEHSELNVIVTRSKNETVIQICAHLHSLFELISGPSDWLCISTFDLIGFLVQQFLPVLLRSADLAGPGTWKVSQTQGVPFEWVHQFRGHTVHSFETFPLIPRAGENLASSQWQSITRHTAKIHKKNTGSILCPVE